MSNRVNNKTNVFEERFKKLKQSIILSSEWKEKINDEIVKNYSNCLYSFKDLVGDNFKEPSTLFYLLNRKLLYLLDNDPEISVRKKDIEFTRKFHSVLKKFGHLALTCSQQIENRNFLENGSLEEDKKIELPDGPVIYVSNHGFRDDGLATVLAAPRHGWFYMGSLPEFYNTPNGLAIYSVGSLSLNRKSKDSKKASLLKAKKLLEEGTDLIIYPEGGWNKSICDITLPLWKGFYKIAKEGNYPIVPIVHYNSHPEILSKKNVIHTVVDDPINISSMSEEEAIDRVRDVLSSWQYKMMEVYGVSTRETEMRGFYIPEEKWDYELKERMKSVGRYDSSIETKADYRDKNIPRPEEVFAPIANMNHDYFGCKTYAKVLVQSRTESDFQRRY